MRLTVSRKPNRPCYADPHKGKYNVKIDGLDVGDFEFDELLTIVYMAALFENPKYRP